jgi:hypothetical protein
MIEFPSLNSAVETAPAHRLKVLLISLKDLVTHVVLSQDLFRSSKLELRPLCQPELDVWRSCFYMRLAAYLAGLFALHTPSPLGWGVEELA